jgi:hypothetical protein
MKHNSNSEANIFSASQQTFPNFMESESLLPLSRDPLENKFTIFGFNTSGKKKLWSPSLDGREKLVTFNKILMRV